MGKAEIVKIAKKHIYLKDLSVTGCCLECTADMDKVTVVQDGKYKLNIKPEREAHVGSFDLEVECKWIRKDNQTFEMGFQIILSPSGRHFQRYVDYLSYKFYKIET